jgi:alpha-glucosidase
MRKSPIAIAGFIVFLFISQAVTARQYDIVSPDGRLTLRITITADTKYEVLYDGEAVIAPSAISLSLDNGLVLGNNGTVETTATRTVDETIVPVAGKNATLQDNFNERTIDFTEGYSLIARAYNEGVSYRFATSLAENVIVQSETANFNFTQSPSVIFPEADGNMYSWEREYFLYPSLANISAARFSITPTLFSYEDKGIRILIAESDQRDYPGMYLQPNGTNGVKGKWAQYPKTVSEPDNVYAYHRVLTREDYLARTVGTRQYPWRVIIVTDDDKQLLNNSLIYKLAPPSELTSTSWITTGKSAWEWWHDAMLENPTIPSGPSNLGFDLYKVYVDFAAQNKLEFITMDAGWGEGYVAQVCQYAATKNVKVILWDFINLPVVNPGRLTQLKNYGAAGVKVDLIERDDQVAMGWIEKLAQDCANRGLLLVLHGCAKPTGLERMYPNIVNYEAVRGEECAKWDYTVNPDQRLYIPFVRMPAGPLDYTPGSMRNVHRSQFTPTPTGIPMTIGTRAHELALFVVFDHPLAFMSDSPTEYRKQSDALRFLSSVPTTWDETRPLAAKVGEFAVIARKKGEEWYIGAIGNEQQRTVQIDFSFLPPGEERTAEIYRDNELTETNAKALTFERVIVTSTTLLDVNLANGGGAAIRVHNSVITGTGKPEANVFTAYVLGEHLVVKAAEPIQQVVLIDMTGRVYVKEKFPWPENSIEVSIPSVPKGLYVVRAKTSSGIRTVKILR